MLDAFKLKEFDLEPVLSSWKNPPRFLGNPKKDPPVDTWLDQVKEGCLERKVPKEYWYKVAQHFLGDKARKRLDELKEVLRHLHGGSYRWDWKRFKTAMRNMGWDIDDKKTQSVKVESKPSGFWSIVGRDKSEEPEVIEEKPIEKKKPFAIRRATVSESPTSEKPPQKPESEKPAPKRRTTWLTRSPSMSADAPAETSKEIVKADAASSSSTSSFWKLHHSSASSTPAATTASTPTSSLVPTPAQTPGEVITTEAHAPLWLLNACGALDFLTTEHPKVMTTLSAVLITVGSLPALPALSAGAGGTILASHAVQAAGAIAVGVGNWLKAAQDSAAAKAVEQGGHAAIEEVSTTSRK
ncbi:hypothetical protein BC834DRAFT_922568 [Gloeopeniophorella convolvens]|nr:hypothetical protein BC834DRAFT_922568 [Gloeopeniophorella convolvens]